MLVKQISLKNLELNTGQIEGLPSNPRLIKDNRYLALVKSIQDDPEMLDVREVVVIEGEKKGTYVVVAGNMRTTVCRELKWDTIPCKVLPKDTAVKKLRAIATKDNVNFGAWDWDAVANEWDVDELADWGVEAYSWNEEDFDGFFEEHGDKETGRKTTKIVLEYPDELYDEVITALGKYGPSPDQAVLSLLGITVKEEQPEV